MHDYIGLVYEQHPSDWKLFTRPRNTEYELVGHFFRYIDDPEMFSIPGQFLEDDEDYDEVNQQLEYYYRKRSIKKQDGQLRHQRRCEAQKRTDHDI